METNYKRTVAGSVGAGLSSVFNGTGRTYYILEHKTKSMYHQLGESQKIIVDQVELGRSSSCQVRFDESFTTVSRRHAAIVKEGNDWKIISLSTTNSTYVNGQPISECVLHNGDEIRLSSNGPIMGFIVPQGSRSVVSSIGLTERMNLFRHQALKPYKTAIYCICSILVIAIFAFTYFSHQQSITIENQDKIISETKQALDDAEKSLTTALFDQRKLEEEIAKAGDISSEQSKEIQKAKDNVSRLTARCNDLSQKLSNLKESNEKTSSVAENPDEVPEPGQKIVTESNSVIAETNPDIKFATIDDCKNAIYYIKMNSISVYSQSNQLLFSINTEDVIGGTGFMLSDGRFVTARRVIQPWFYYGDTNFGDTKEGNKTISWYGWRLYWASMSGMKVIGSFTAYSPAGTSFQFLSSEMSHKGDIVIDTKSTYYTKGHNISTGKELISIINKYNSSGYVVSSADRNDWATIAKVEQLQYCNGGLKCSIEYSSAPKGTEQVSIMGYPKKSGFSDSNSVSPKHNYNNINVSDLNRNGLIELSSKRFEPGNDGSPVLISQDGEMIVIGILCHSDNDSRDLVVPIREIFK